MRAELALIFDGFATIGAIHINLAIRILAGSDVLPTVHGAILPEWEVIAISAGGRDYVPGLLRLFVRGWWCLGLYPFDSMFRTELPHQGPAAIGAHKAGSFGTLRDGRADRFIGRFFAAHTFQLLLFACNRRSVVGDLEA
jgi:hypothetical protein